MDYQRRFSRLLLSICCACNSASGDQSNDAGLDSQPPSGDAASDSVTMDTSASGIMDANASVTITKGRAFETLDLGSASDRLCLVQTVSGRMHGTCSPPLLPGAMMMTSCDPNTPNDPADALSTGFDLYVDSVGHWQLFTEGGQTGPDDDPGPSPPNCSDQPMNPLPSCSHWQPPDLATDPFSVTVGCLPWSALGVSQPPTLVRINNGIQVSDLVTGPLRAIPPEVQALPAQSTCFLATATDDYAHGGADLSSASFSLYATDWVWPNGAHGAETLAASAICMPGLAFVDFPAGGALPADAFCGLAHFGDMAVHGSSVSVSGSTVTAKSASLAARCLRIMP